MMTDPIADMITRIRNEIMIKRKTCIMPSSKLKFQIAKCLQREGFLTDVREEEGAIYSTLHVRINYGPNGENVINEISRVSKPGCRVYKSISDVLRIKSGLGMTILTTSKGVLSDREAREQNVGGELLIKVL
jgi:small subunit ribosomal protein S8